MIDTVRFQKFDCGCVWDWQKHEWGANCGQHTIMRPKDCTCLNPGQDNGATTCWQHHDCSDGSCTHTDGD